MEETVTIPKKEYEELKRKACETDTLEQAKLSLKDLREGKVFTDFEEA